MNPPPVPTHHVWIQCIEECGNKIRLARDFQTELFREAKAEVERLGEHSWEQQIRGRVDGELKAYFESKLKE